MEKGTAMIWFEKDSKIKIYNKLIARLSDMNGAGFFSTQIKKIEREIEVLQKERDERETEMKKLLLQKEILKKKREMNFKPYKDDAPDFFKRKVLANVVTDYCVLLNELSQATEINDQISTLVTRIINSQDKALKPTTTTTTYAPLVHVLQRPMEPVVKKFLVCFVCQNSFFIPDMCILKENVSNVKEHLLKVGSTTQKNVVVIGHTPVQGFSLIRPPSPQTTNEKNPINLFNHILRTCYKGSFDALKDEIHFKQ